MTKLFKTKSPEYLRSVRREVRLTKSEEEKIKKSADLRQLDFSEFMRRAALGRRTDVNYNVDVVLALLELDRKINEIGLLHKAMIERGITPPIDDWRPVKNEIRMAVVRIAQQE